MITRALLAMRRFDLCPDRSRHHHLAAHQQPRRPQQRRARDVLRVSRIDRDFDAEFAGRMLDGDLFDARLRGR